MEPRLLTRLRYWGWSRPLSSLAAEPTAQRSAHLSPRPAGALRPATAVRGASAEQCSEEAPQGAAATIGHATIVARMPAMRSRSSWLAGGGVRGPLTGASDALPSPRSRAATGLAPRSFFFSDPATTEIYTLSLHDALPI